MLLEQFLNFLLTFSYFFLDCIFNCRKLFEKNWSCYSVKSIRWIFRVTLKCSFVSLVSSDRIDVYFSLFLNFTLNMWVYAFVWVTFPLLKVWVNYFLNVGRHSYFHGGSASLNFYRKQGVMLIPWEYGEGYWSQFFSFLGT